MRDVVVVARGFSCAALALALASCGGSSDVTPPPPLPPALTNSIVFVSDRSGAFEIWVMNADGSHVRQLTTTPEQKYGPVFSPDGRKIAYVTGVIEINGASNIHVMNSDGTEDRTLPGGPWVDYEPTWSPDGARIAFVSTRDGNSEIYAMNADGTNQTNLTKDSVFDVEPSWSPTAASILFVSGRAGATPNIYAMSPTGASVDSLTEGTNPEWSPTGSKFLFVRSSQLFISATTDGSSVTDITPTGPVQRTPQWSPDERKIVFATDGIDGEQIWTENAQDGSGAQRLTAVGDGDNYYPSWTRH